jgi:hypothetical protein
MDRGTDEHKGSQIDGQTERWTEGHTDEWKHRENGERDILLAK